MASARNGSNGHVARSNVIVEVPVPPPIRVEIANGVHPPREIEMTFGEFLLIALDARNDLYGAGPEGAKRLARIAGICSTKHTNGSPMVFAEDEYEEICDSVRRFNWGARVNRQLVPFHEALFEKAERKNAS
jgi:hypothetical protein